MWWSWMGEEMVVPEDVVEVDIDENDGGRGCRGGRGGHGRRIG